MKERYDITLLLMLVVFVVCGGCEDIHNEETSLLYNETNITRTSSVNDYYWYRGKKVPLIKEEDKVYTLRSSNNDNNQRSINNNNTLLWVVEKRNTLTNADNIIYQADVYTTEQGDELLFSNLFFVKLKETTEYSQLVELASQNQVNILGQAARMEYWYKLQCTKDSKGSAVQMANLFYESGLFQYAHPDMKFEIEPAGNVGYESTLPRPNDTYFNLQWHLYDSINNRDINYLEARQITQGRPEIKIAVIEEGLPKLDHPDLNLFDDGNYVGYIYQGEENEIFNSIFSSPNVEVDNHATACIGIIAAKTNNGIGVAGIAPNCSIISICMDDINSDSSVEKTAYAFNIAKEKNASVISCSWYRNSGYIDYGVDIIEEAISLCMTNGRGGKGCVVVFAAGNLQGDDNPISYPANCNDDIIVVGALQRNGEKHIESRVGPELDIMAPGETIYTTIMDAETIDEIDDNIYGALNRTSAACPQVAAVAALILSVDSTLTMHEVTQRLLQSANRNLILDNEVSFEQYVPNIGWRCDRYGFGMLDAYNALCYTSIPTELSLTLSDNIDGTYRATEKITIGGMVQEYDANVALSAPTLIIVDGFNISQDATFTFTDPTNAPYPTILPTPNDDPMVSIDPFPNEYINLPKP